MTGDCRFLYLQSGIVRRIIAFRHFDEVGNPFIHGVLPFSAFVEYGCADKRFSHLQKILSKYTKTICLFRPRRTSLKNIEKNSVSFDNRGFFCYYYRVKLYLYVRICYIHNSLHKFRENFFHAKIRMINYMKFVHTITA